MAIQNNANIGFEKQIWDAACVLWGHIPAAEYRKVIVGLIFLRYISSAFEKRYQQLVEEGDGFEDDKDAYAEDNIFFVPEDARWSKIASAAHTPEIGTVIDDAMRAIEKENTTLKNVLPKNYASPDLDKRVLGEVVDLFTNMDMGDTEESKDLLGRTYEYCIQQFAAYEGVKGGEFYTPASIVKTIVAILKPFKNCRVYDPCCGSGGMFVQSAKFIQAHSGKRGEIAVYGQESNADTWKMAKMNMAIRGIDADFGPYQADTFFNDLHKTLKADFIMANPPFNLSNWGQDKLKDDLRWKYGTPPAGNANYAWIQHMIHHLAPNGKIGFVLANGALSSQSSGEGEIRKNIIQADLVEGIVALPTQLFYSVTIPVTLWFISKNKKQKGKTLFIDARKMGYMVDRKHRDFTDEDIQKLSDTFTAFQDGMLEDVKGFCAVADLQEIEKQDFILTPGRYVGIEEVKDDGEPFEEKMTRLTAELSDMFAKSHELEEEIRKKLGAIASALKQAMNDYTSRDKKNYGDTDVAKVAYPKFLEKLSVCRDMFHGYDYSKFTGGTDLERAKTISGAVNFIMDREKADDKDSFVKEALMLHQALSLCSSLVDEGSRFEAAFFESVRVLVLRLTNTGVGKKISLPEMNARINELLKQSIKSDGVINLFSDIKEEFSLFDPKFLEEVANMKEKNLAVELLKKLIAEQVSVYRRTNVVKSEKFSEIMQRSLNAYLNGMLTNEEVIEEMLNLAKQIAAAKKEGDQLGLTADELAFYDALTKPQAIKDFYENEELIAITKELADTLRRNKTIDWQKRESARAKMRMLIKKLLKKHKYPPEGMEDAVQTVMTQCELWTDNNDMGEEKVVDFRKAGYTYMQEKNDVLMVAEKREVYGDMETKIVKD